MTDSSATPAAGYFPVEWADPAHTELYWMFDQMHHPRPVTPYTASVDGPAFADGSSLAFQSFGIPGAFLSGIFNGYWYVGVRVDDREVESWLPRVQQGVVTQLSGLLDRWRDVYLPEVMLLNERLRGFPYASASDAELIAMLDASRRDRAREWQIHMLAVAPVFFAAGQLQAMWRDAFGEERAHEPLTLLGGFPNKTIEAGAELWKLSREALAVPRVATLIAETPVRRIMPLLGTTDAGRAFRARVEAYLETYGYRSGAFEMADAPWTDDPSVVLSTMRDFMRQPDDMHPARLVAQAAAERDALMVRVLPQIDVRPEAGMLRTLLSMAQQYLPIQEDHNFYIDQMNTVLMRRPPLEAGQRLAAADALALPDDVFWLTIDEVKNALCAPSSRPWAELVLARRAEWVRQCDLTPPSSLGTPLPEGLQDTGFAAFFGQPVEQDATSEVLRGTPASRGTATGVARVIRTLDESHRLQPGEILVCPMTMPAWTPLFAIAAAVVTDSGGALSHSAIVAREYRIPCVVGTTSGTRRIADGARVTVDGGSGTVTIEQD